MENKHISDYKIYLDDGKSFLNRVRKSVLKPEVYTPDIIYNITGMAIEKYIMGYLMYHNKLPFNHTFKDLLEGLNQVSVPPKDLSEKLEYLDGLQEICSLESYAPRKITPEDVTTIVETGIMIENYVKEKLDL